VSHWLLATVPVETIGMSAEMVVALCALGTAVAGAAVAIFKFGGLAKEVEAVKELKDEVAALRQTIVDLSNALSEMRGAMRAEAGRPMRSLPSSPPFGGSDV
jgi:hypothetical protein